MVVSFVRILPASALYADLLDHPDRSDMTATVTPVLRTAVVGLGRIGFGYHVPSVVSHPGFELVGLVDPSAERRAEAGTRWQVACFAELGEMLAATKAELVVLASPTPFHAAQARDCFAHGAHVFCDKPVALSVADYDAMIEAGRRSQRDLLAYQPARGLAPVRCLKHLLASGRLGRVHLVRHARSDFVRRNDWQAFAAHGGGMLNNYGSHCLDELLWLLDFPRIETVFCQLRCAVTTGDAEDVVKAVLVAGDGCLIDLDISQACAQPPPAWQVDGDRGSAVWDARSGRWSVKYFLADEAPAPAAQSGLAAEGRLYRTEQLPWRQEWIAPNAASEMDYYDSVWRHFARGDAPPVAPTETRALIRLIERCRESATSCRPA